MEKRTLLALVLTVVVWIVWFAFFKPEVKKKKLQLSQKVEEKTTTKEKTSSESIVVDKDKSQKSAKSVVASKKLQGNEKNVTFETEKFSVVLTSRGAAIKSIRTKERKGRDGKPLELVVGKSPYKSKSVMDFPIHFDDDEFLDGSELDDSIWSISSVTGNGVTFSADISFNNSIIKVQKIFTFTKSGHDFNVDYKLINPSNNDISLPEKKIIISPADMLGPTLDYSNTYNRLMGVYSIDNDYEQATKGGGFMSKAGIIKKEAGSIDYVGLMSRYIVILMVPQEFTGTEVIIDNRSHTGFRTGISVSMKRIKARSEVVKSFKVYLGEKDKDKLGQVSESIVDAADVSKWIEPIRYFVKWSLLNLNKLFGNLGWALVVFSILTKIVFMPLTIKSTESMKKMQALSPKINEIKAKYKDKPDIIQKETMKMYKENKVNPMGGCFPMLLQMPFFFGLYSALLNSIDLWNAPFILWIQDLSMPDTVAQIAGYNLNILPLIMTLSTFLQQRLTTVDTGKQQQIMMTLMPVIFIFIFWSMPSGLVLYWTLQNLYQVAHQLVVNHRKTKAAA